MTDDTARWLPVVGHEGYYEVSDLGQVRGVERRIEKSNGQTCVLSARELTLKSDRSYKSVSLSRDGVVRSARVHVLVLEAFVGPCPEGEEGLHGDDDGANNALTNLRWGTPTENRRDCVQNGHHHYASRERCRRGHLYAGRNLFKRPDGGRRCRSCVHANPRATGEEARQRLADAYYRDLMAVA